MNPRAGHPTYTLSRGASSATWVHLLAWKFTTKVFDFHRSTCISTHVHWLVYQRKWFLSTVFLYFLKIVFQIVYIVDTITFLYNILCPSIMSVSDFYMKLFGIKLFLLFIHWMRFFLIFGLGILHYILFPFLHNLIFMFRISLI